MPANPREANKGTLVVGNDIVPPSRGISIDAIPSPNMNGGGMARAVDGKATSLEVMR